MLGTNAVKGSSSGHSGAYYLWTAKFKTIKTFVTRGINRSGKTSKVPIDFAKKRKKIYHSVLRADVLMTHGLFSHWLFYYQQGLNRRCCCCLYRKALNMCPAVPKHFSRSERSFFFSVETQIWWAKKVERKEVEQRQWMYVAATQLSLRNTT